MKNETTHNGWTNYATWRVNLEIFDNDMIYDYCQQHVDQCGELPTVHDVREYLESYMDELIDMEYEKSFLVSYAHAFLMEANYHEIAETHLTDIKQTEGITE